MPTVPVRQVQSTPLPGVRISPDAPAAAFPGAVNTRPDLSGVQHVAQQIYQDARDRADQIAINDADAKLSDAVTQVQAKGLSMRGMDAAGATQQARGDFSTAAGGIRMDLSTDRQRLLFDQRAAARWADVHETLERHALAESINVDKQSTDALLAATHNDALTNYNDPSRVAGAIAKQGAILHDFATRNGVPPEVIAQQTAEQRSGTLVGVINRMLEAPGGGDLMAKDYYARIGDQLTGDDRAKVDGALKAGSVRGESQRQADQIVATAKTLSDGVAAARQITDPDVRDATETRVRADFAERQQSDLLARNAAYQNATNIVERTHSLDSIPAADMATFTVGERTQLRDYLGAVIKGVPVQTNYRYLNDMMAKASSPATRADFMNTPFSELRANLSDSDLKDAMQLRSSLAKGQQDADEKIAGFRSVADAIDGTLRSAGYNLTDKNPDKQKDIENFRRAVNLQVSALRGAGKVPTALDIQNIVDDSFLKLHNVKTGDEQRVFQRAPGDQVVFTIRDIPPARVNQIKASLQSNGVPVTDSNIMKAYNQFLSSIPAVAVPQP